MAGIPDIKIEFLNDLPISFEPIVANRIEADGFNLSICDNNNVFWSIPSGANPYIKRLEPVQYPGNIGWNVTDIAHGKGASAFYGAVYDNERYIWIIPNLSTDFVRIDTVTGNLDSFPHGLTATGNWFHGFFDGKNIWFIPYNKTYLTKIDSATGTFEHIDMGLTGTAHFNGYAYDSDLRNIWMAPNAEDFFLKFNTVTESITHIAHDEPAGTNLYDGGVYANGYIWMVPRNSTHIAQIDPVTNTVTYIAHDMGSNAFQNPYLVQEDCFDGRYIWLCPWNSTDVIRLDSTDGSLTSYPYGKAASYAFKSVLTDGRYVWFAPNNSMYILRFDSINERFSTIYRDQSYASNAFNHVTISKKHRAFATDTFSKILLFSPNTLLAHSHVLKYGYKEFITDSSGFYSFSASLKDSCKVEPVSDLYNFSPDVTYVNLSATQNISINNFTGTQKHFEIRGVISSTGVPVPGISVQLSGTSSGVVITDSNGFYSFAPVDPGSYTITPTGAPGFESFTPTDLDVTVTNADSLFNDFEAESTVSLPTPTLMTNGTVNSVLHDGADLYIGGLFSRVLQESTPRLQRVSTTTGASNPIPNLLDGFSGGEVLAIVKSGNYIYCAGRFSSYRGTACRGVAKIDVTTGAYVSAFNVGSTGFTGGDGSVGSLVLSSDGLSIYCGGYFTGYKGTTRGGICKLDSTTAALDATFVANPGCGGSSPTVAHILLDGNALYLSGSMTTFNGTTRNRFCKINATTAAVDVTFDTSTGFSTAGGTSTSMSVLDSTGTYLYICGTFTTYKGSTRERVVRVNASTAAIDATFNSISGFNARVRQMAYDGTYLYCAGDFTVCKSVSRLGVAKLNATTAALNLTFDSATGFSTGAYITKLLLSGSSLYCSGGFTTYKGIARERVAKLNSSTAALDVTFDSALGCNNDCYDMVLDGSDLYLGGYFTVYGGYARNSLAKFNKYTNVIDPIFNIGTGFAGGNGVTTLLLNEGSLYCGGEFLLFNSTTSINRLIKLNSVTGVVDGTFNTSYPNRGANNTVKCLGFDSINNNLYVGGAFTKFNNIDNQYLTVINAATGDVVIPTWYYLDGSVNTLYYDNLNLNLYIGGDFTAYNSASRYYVAKLNRPNVSTFEVDVIFDSSGAGLNGSVYNLVLDSINDHLYIGGYFTTYKGPSRIGIVKLNSITADLDLTFVPGAGFSDGVGVMGAGPKSMVLDSGNLYCGGNFIRYNSISRERIAKLNSTTAALDVTFDSASGFNGTVNSLIKSNTNLICGGSFTTYKGSTKYSVNKIDVSDASQT